MENEIKTSRIKRIINWIKIHPGKSIILSIVTIVGGYILFAGIMLVLLLSGIANEYSGPFATKKPPLPTPYSQRGNPVPATDVPVTLPPDPGEAGKQTLAGIDSNNDGVRDDLEREIVYMYPQNEEVRRVLRAMVKKGQDVITTEGDHEHFKELMISYFGFQNCYSFLVYGSVNINRDYKNQEIIWSMIQNTPERGKRFIENDNKAKPYVAPGFPGSCDPVKDQY